MASGVDLAAVFGPAKGGKKPPAAGADPMAEMMGEGEPMPAEEPAAEMLPPDFEAAASEFLDASLPAEDRMHALKRAIEACVDAREGGGY